MISVGDLLSVFRIQNEASSVLATIASDSTATAAVVASSMNQIATVGRNAQGQFVSLKAPIDAVSQSLGTVSTVGRNAQGQFVSLTSAAQNTTPAINAVTQATNQATAALGGGGGGGGASGGGGGGGGGGFNAAAGGAAYQLTLFGRGLREAGVLVTGALSVPIVGAVDAVIKFSGQFETAMTRVITLAGASRGEVESLRQGVLDLGVATGIGPAELAKGLFVLESYGLRGAKAMDTLTVAANMSSLGMGDTASVARGLTGVLFSYKEQNLSAAQAGDILTKTVQLGNMRIDELIPAMAKLNPVAAAMGIKFEDVAAAVATFTHAGVDSAVATTGLRAALGNVLTDSAKTEKGFTALQRATGDMTLTMANFKAEIANKGLTAALIDLTNAASSAGEDGTKALSQIFPNIRALTEILGVYKINGDMVVDTLHQLKDAHGTVNNAVIELHKTWQFQWDQMTVELQEVAINLGTTLMPVFKGILDLFKDNVIPAIQGVVGAFNSLPPEVQQLIIIFGGLFAILGPGMIIIGQLAMAIGNLSRGIGFELIASIASTELSWSMLVINVKSVQTAFTSMFNVILAHPFIIIAAAIAGITLVYVNWKNATAEAALAAETAGAKHDAIALAISRNAKLTGDATKATEEYTAALKYNQEWMDNVRNVMTPVNNQLAEMKRNGASATEQADYLAFKIHVLSNEGNLGTTQLKDFGQKIKDTGLSFDELNPTLQGVVTGLQHIKESGMTTAEVYKSIQDKVNALTAEQRKLIDSDHARHETAQQILDDLIHHQIATGADVQVISLYEKQAAPAIKAAQKEMTDLAKAKEMVRLAGIPLTDAQTDEIIHMQALNVKIGENIISVHAMASEIGAADVQVKKYLETQKLQIDIEKELAKVRHIEATGKPLDAHTIGGSIGALPALGDLTTQKFETIYDKLRKVESGGKPLGPLGGDIPFFRPSKNDFNQVDAYAKSLSILSTEFTKLGQISGGALGTFMINMGRTVVLLETARKDTEQIGGATANLMLGKDAQKIGGDFGPLSVLFAPDTVASKTQKAAAAIQTVAAVYQGAIAVWNATSASASAAGNALGGMVAGAQAGAAFGPWGMAIGAAAGLVVGIIRGKPDWAKAADEVANDFGVKISDSLAKTIADSAKSDFHGSTQAAALSQLGAIITASGGLTDKNLTVMTARLHDVFSMIETHQMTIAQGTKILDDNWAAFAAAGTDASGRISEGLKEIIRLDGELGTQSKAIADWQKGQGSAALTGFVAVAAALDDEIKGYDALKKAVDDASAAQVAAMKSGDVAEAARQAVALKKALEDQFKAAEGAKQGLDDLGLQAIASFSAAVASGSSFADALSKIHPALDSLKKAYSDLGIDVDNVALKNLMMVDEVVSKNPTLIAAIQGLSGEMVALDNLGVLNIETFGAMERTGTNLFGRLLNAAIDATGGYDKTTGAVLHMDDAQRIALSQMQDYLHKAKDEAEKLGIPLDDNTQKMIDQSKDLGIWKDTGKDATQTLIGKIGELIDVLLGKLKPAIDAASKPVSAPWAGWTLPEVPNFQEPGGGGGIPMAGGGDWLVTRPTLFLAGEAGPERATFSGAGKTEQTYSNSTQSSEGWSQVSSAIKDQTRALKLAFREALVMGQ